MEVLESTFLVEMEICKSRFHKTVPEFVRRKVFHKRERSFFPPEVSGGWHKLTAYATRPFIEPALFYEIKPHSQTDVKRILYLSNLDFFLRCVIIASMPIKSIGL